MLRHVAAASPAISPDEASVQGWLAALSDALLASKGNDWLHEKLKEIITHLASQVRHTEAAESACCCPGDGNVSSHRITGALAPVLPELGADVPLEDPGRVGEHVCAAHSPCYLHSESGAVFC